MAVSVDGISRPSTPTQKVPVPVQKAHSMPGSWFPKTPSPPRKSPRNSANIIWTQEQRRRVFLEHLTRWASNHDASVYFHGKLSLLAASESSGETFELGKSVKCILTNTAYKDARKQIVIRLFPPRERDARYKMVIRCGAGWMSARDFLSKEYFVFQHAESGKKKFECLGCLDESLKWRSGVLGPKPADKDTVAVYPLFLPFLRLPLELQQMVLGTAAGLKGTFRPSRDRASNPFSSRTQSPISLATMLRISRSLNEHLVSWVYHATTFQFGLTGFTNFLWQSGPLKRAQLKRVTFRFTNIALLHCLRWLAPDPVFDLFLPPVHTHPHALQFLWRCQIRDLSQELHLFVLTIDLYDIPEADIPMMVRILNQAFGSIDRLRFKYGREFLSEDDERLAGLKKGTTWREMCKGWYERHRRDHYYMSDTRRRRSMEDLEWEMDQKQDFFDGVRGRGRIGQGRIEDPVDPYIN